MDIPPTILVIVGFIIVVLGIGAGMLLSSLNEEVEPEENSVDQAPPGGAKGRYTPVARLWRERGSGTLIVEMDNKAYVSTEAINEIQRERLEKTARDLRAWLGMGLASFEPGPAAPASSAETSPAAPAASAGSAVPPAAAAATAASASAASAAAAAARPAAGKEEPAPVAPVVGSKSIVMQIEDILQDMIAGTPLAQRGLHLTEDPARGVIVKVGAEQFEGIDAVPDAEVKATIRAAVSEWEKSQ